tara:strand:+ start:373 stop:804 length:432 start_codon:yes stop_codon:yes gene_type:complete
MGAVSLSEIIVSPLNRISTVGGDVMHALKNSENEFNGFGEVYFSWADPGAIKAWKCHQKMTLNLVVPLGEISFVFHLDNKHQDFRKEIIGDTNYVRLTVPPGIWFGFKGIGHQNLLMNLADISHDPDEVLRKEPSEIEYNWSS